MSLMSHQMRIGGAMLGSILTTPAWTQVVQYGAAPAGMCVFSRPVALSTSQAGRGASQRLQVLLDGVKAELAPQQAALVADDKALAAARATLPAAQFQQRAQALQQRAQTLQQLDQLRGAQLARTRAQAEQQIGQALTPILAATITARKCGIVLDGGTILGANATIDLTPTVVQELDRRLPAIQVQLAIPQSVRQP